jgi:hypothetical protein
MTGQELIANLRESILDDAAPPYLWSDTELLRGLNYAEVQACRRAHLIIDGTTANDNGTAATKGTAGQKPLCTLTIVAGQATYNLSPKVLQIKRCQLRSMAYPLTGPKTYPELDELMSGWIGTAGTVIGNEDGVKAKGSIISNGTNVTAGQTVTLGTHGYTFVATLAAENNIFIGTSGRDTLSHLKSAINLGGTAATSYQCSGSHPSVSATMTALLGTSGTLALEALLNGIAGNDIALATDAVNLTVSGDFMTGGINNSGTPTYFLNEPGNTITFVLAPAYIDTASLVVSRIPLTPFTLRTSPEIDEKYHEGLMDWAAHLAFMKPDAETINLNLAKVYEDRFNRQFGILPDAYSDRMRKVLSQKQRMRPRVWGE